MSTDNELPVQQKPRLNPLDFRNTDLVSRLLAATPPYLYNMPMVPNSYFFSEMLRSFVQNKTDASNSTSTPSSTARNNGNTLGYHRRPRKRPWNHSKGLEYFATKEESTKSSLSGSSWSGAKQETREVPLRSLELTPAKIADQKAQCSSTEVNSSITHEDKLDALENQVGTFHNSIPSQDGAQNLLLPPPPPLWYPSMYPTPYGIDPLHFFIDLRVSGHIYDRKNGKESNTTEENNSSTLLDQNKDTFRQSRHASAFSVPITSNGSKNMPINLSNVKNEENKLKFDVKSMMYNKTSTTYVMRNINNIYKEISNHKIDYKSEDNEIKIDSANDESGTADINVDGDFEEPDVKRAKHLKALFGLELVVDYMKKKPSSTVINVNSESSGTTSENESVGSPALDVVDVNDDSTITM